MVLSWLLNPGIRQFWVVLFVGSDFGTRQYLHSYVCEFSIPEPGSTWMVLFVDSDDFGTRQYLDGSIYGALKLKTRLYLCGSVCGF